MTKRFVPLTAIKPKPIQWLWRDRVPLGSLTILEGDPGSAKSTVVADLIARLTTGRAMPACANGMSAAGAVLLQAEDDPRSTVRPNLEAAGAACERVMIEDRRPTDHPIILPDDLPVVENAVAAVRAKLLVVDPISEFVAENLNSEQGARRALGPLARFARRAKIAIILIRHHTKNPSASPMHRGGGSVGIIALARSAPTVVPDPAGEDRYRHLIVQVKTNLAAADTLAYRTVRDNNCTTIEWLGAAKYTALDLTASARAERSARRDAREVLYLLLKGGPLPSKAVEREAREHGVKFRTLERAKAELDVRSGRKDYKWGWEWLWQLPPQEEENELLRSIRLKYEQPEEQSHENCQAVTPG